ncbi:hypothetical protein INS49_004327 [Diaporthe citri]|uniref:uncharacterized protein n=1 Tax=Diaporthe citri TaxID=83186 RepID=UPI001C7E3F41|nr:uncharacterized protein INS49_004327 [Diaporthe citri]KAG6355245.1 hypothetical protein INS49_004327 [Diaporthe citri]
MDSSTGAKIELRQRERSDIPRLLDIITAVHTETGYPVGGPSCFEAFLDPPPDQLLHAITAVLITPADQQDADGEHAIAGHATIMSPGAAGLLSRFFVDPAAQARGVGSGVLEAATAWARREGKRLVLVVLEKDGGAIRLYDRAGWLSDWLWSWAYVAVATLRK